MCGQEQRPRPRLGSAWRNFSTADLPLTRRLRLVAVNSWWKVRRRQGCCGHYGEPGC